MSKSIHPESNLMKAYSSLLKNTPFKQWDMTLDISDIWQKVKEENNEISFGDFLKELVKRIQALPLKENEKKFINQNIIDNLNEMIEKEDDDRNYFDEIFQDFYDFCDKDKRIWIKR